MNAFKKIVSVGTGPYGVVWAKIEWNDGRLSITGVEGPRSNGDAKGGSGQIVGHEWDITDYCEGWDAELVAKFRAAWDRWHLNDMRAGCAHQRAEGWNERPIDPSKPTTAYGNHIPGKRSSTWNMLVWVRPDEHPEGLLTKPCPTCGYKYGTAWLHEDVPEDVLAFLAGLPTPTSKPAWV